MACSLVDTAEAQLVAASRRSESSSIMTGMHICDLPSNPSNSDDIALIVVDDETDLKAGLKLLQTQFMSRPVSSSRRTGKRFPPAAETLEVVLTD